MELKIQTITFLLGCGLVIVAILGGGIEVKEIKIPALAGWPRIVSAAFGSLLLAIALLKPDLLETRTQTVASVPQTAAEFQVYGEIGKKWQEMGGEAATGSPLNSESDALGGGRYNDFAKQVTIAWTPATGAHPVYGLIRDRWISLGREGGRCGYPITDEFDIDNGRRSNFQHGFIMWQKNQSSAEAQC